MVKKNKELHVAFWLIDGFVGILALVIYNFALYILSAIGLGAPIKTMQQTMGYFGMNTFLDLGFSVSQMLLGLVIVLLISFCLGIGIGSAVRRRRGEFKKKHK